MIELMIVIAIIGILAAIAVPSFLAYKRNGCDASANSDVQNAFTAAQAYFSDFPEGAVTLEKLEAIGFVNTKDVTVTVVNDRQETLVIEARHAQGSKTFTVDTYGNISTS